MHLSRKGTGDFVVHRLQQFTTIHWSLAVNNTAIKKDNVCIARPNQHLIVKDNYFLLGAGPEEKRFRPSIDVLFRSATMAYSFFVQALMMYKSWMLPNSHLPARLRRQFIGNE